MYTVIDTCRLHTYSDPRSPFSARSFTDESNWALLIVTSGSRQQASLEFSRYNIYQAYCIKENALGVDTYICA